MYFPQKTTLKNYKLSRIFTLSNTSPRKFLKRNKKYREMNLKLQQAEQEIAAQALVILEQRKLLKAIVESLSLISGELTNISKKKIYHLERKINQLLQDGDDLNFKTLYKLVHPQFFTLLSKHYPSLSPNELKHCAFIKINLSNKEIAQLLHIESKSVDMAHYRLRKKLNVPSRVKLMNLLRNY